MPSFVSMLGVVPEDHGHLLGDLLDVYSVSCARKPTLLQSIRDLCNAMFYMTRHRTMGEFMLKNKSRSFKRLTFRSCETVRQSSLETIAAIAKVRAHDPSLRK